MLNDTATFRRVVIGAAIPNKPTNLPPDRIAWTLKALTEETGEFMEAAELGDIPGAVDALLDLAYFALGRIVEMGLPPGPAWREIHRANLEKKKGNIAKRGDGTDDATKPVEWMPPDHSWMLDVSMDDIRRARAKRVSGGPIPERPSDLLGAIAGLTDEEIGPLETDPEDTRPDPMAGEREGRTQTPASNAAMKAKEGKPRLDLIPLIAEEAEARAFEFGLTKYAEWDWTKGLPWSITIAALKRHVGAFSACRDPNDQATDSLVHHLGHAKACCSMLLDWAHRGAGKDDRRMNVETGDHSRG